MSPGTLSEPHDGCRITVVRASPRRPHSSPASLSRVGSEYTPRQVAELLQRGEIQLIDVRQPHEHEAGRIAGDRLIELTQLAAEVETMDRDRPVVFYCRSGSRSAMATEAFRAAGFNAHNLAGGLLQWQAAGLPLDPPDGCVADS
jgi:rhodanese-related sulfurtransferase